MQGFPLLGLLRRLRCHTGFSGSKSHSLWGRSGLGNPRLDNLRQLVVMSEWVFVRYPLTAVGCHGYLAIGVYLSPITTAYGESNYPTPSAQVCRLGLSFKQSSFIPHSQRFTLPFSSGSIVSQLTTLPICYTPHRVSLLDKSAGDRAICTSFRNTFSYCRATGRIPNCPQAALAYAAAFPGARYNLKKRP